MLFSYKYTQLQKNSNSIVNEELQAIIFYSKN
jgi:hypothetical protein